MGKYADFTFEVKFIMKQLHTGNAFRCIGSFSLLFDSKD